jgi:N utilization substance protein A
MSKPNFEFLDALGQIARDKGISVETLLDALANALVAAYKRRPDAAEEAVVTIDPESGEIRVYGQELDEDGNVTREWDDTPDDFGRIAAQTAKQVILQRIREVERDLKYEEYAGREGDIVTGIVQQTDNRYTLLDLGKVEALLPQAEQVSYERYEHGARLKAYIVEVRKTTKGPQIVVSRSHPGLIKRLFELEVPEISSGAVEIKAAAREPGHRTKIAVWSNDPNVDPVGACVGARGSRVRMVTNELRGERVDVVPFSDDPVELIQSALAPARVREVRLDDETGTATVIVSDYQLSLAIGKEGQNARLAARLTGWRIDIKSETQLAEEESGYAGEEWAEGEWIQNEAGEMVWQPAEGGTAVSATEWSQGAEGAEGGFGPPKASGAGEHRSLPRTAPTGREAAAGRQLRRAGRAAAAGQLRRARGDRDGSPAAADVADPAGGGASVAPRARRVRHSPGSDLHRVPADRIRPDRELVRVVRLGGGRWRSAGGCRSGCLAVPGLTGVHRRGGQAPCLRPGVAGSGRDVSGGASPGGTRVQLLAVGGTVGSESPVL